MRWGRSLLTAFGFVLLLSFVEGDLGSAWGISLEELAAGGKREEADTGTFLVWFDEFLSYTTSKFLLEGAVVAIEITVVSMVIGLFLGLVLALMRLSNIWPLSALAWFYIWFMRGTPQLLQLVFIYDALPLVGLRFDTFTTAVIGFALNEAAFSGEIIRGGIISVDRSQRTAASSLGNGAGADAASHHHAAGIARHPARDHQRHHQHAEADFDRLGDLRQRADLSRPADRRAELQVLYCVRRRGRDLSGDDERDLHRPGPARAPLQPGEGAAGARRGGARANVRISHGSAVPARCRSRATGAEPGRCLGGGAGGRGRRGGTGVVGGYPRAPSRRDRRRRRGALRRVH